MTFCNFNNNLILVGICGYKQSGKDTASGLLKEHLVNLASIKRIITFHFASQLKDEVATILGTTSKHLNENKNHPLIRHVYQWYGNDFAKIERGELVWIETAEKVLKEINRPTIVLIPDLRFKVEEKWLRNNNGCIIRIEKDGQENRDSHPSEVELDKISPDWYLKNNGESLTRYSLECRWIAGFIKEKYHL